MTNFSLALVSLTTATKCKIHRKEGFSEIKEIRSFTFFWVMPILLSKVLTYIKTCPVTNLHEKWNSLLLLQKALYIKYMKEEKEREVGMWSPAHILQWPAYQISKHISLFLSFTCLWMMRHTFVWGNLSLHLHCCNMGFQPLHLPSKSCRNSVCRVSVSC